LHSKVGAPGLKLEPDSQSIANYLILFTGLYIYETGEVNGFTISVEPLITHTPRWAKGLWRGMPKMGSKKMVEKIREKL
jgi:hypothetical protein